mmetsp:Transcript_90971/g.293709  ORF Transcript_90971/g.293709 Transcript_90971/m.293709 type:complete len:252 (+) Transcript_90971:722-1477(+)
MPHRHDFGAPLELRREKLKKPGKQLHPAQVAAPAMTPGQPRGAAGAALEERHVEARQSNLRVHLHKVDGHEGERVGREMATLSTGHSFALGPQLHQHAEHSDRRVQLRIRAQQPGIGQGLDVLEKQVQVQAIPELQAQDGHSRGPDILNDVEALMCHQNVKEVILQRLRCKRRPCDCGAGYSAHGGVKVGAVRGKSVGCTSERTYAPAWCQQGHRLLEFDQASLQRGPTLGRGRHLGELSRQNLLHCMLLG